MALYEKSVMPEKLGYRDMDISLRHREWGYQCPAVDIDFLMCEYSFGQTVAIIEYKHHNIKQINPDNPSFKVIKNLADQRYTPIPFFVVMYWRDIWAFKVHPMNLKARVFVEAPTMMTEYDYVSLLYKMRRNFIQTEIAEKLNRELPSEE